MVSTKLDTVSFIKLKNRGFIFPIPSVRVRGKVRVRVSFSF